MSRIAVFTIFGICSLHGAAASLDDDMIEPSQEFLRMKVADAHVAQFVKVVESYAHSIGLEGSYNPEKQRRSTILAGYDSPLEQAIRARSIYLMRNEQTDCVGIEVRVWDDLQTDEAKQIREKLANQLTGMFEAMSESECGLTF